MLNSGMVMNRDVTNRIRKDMRQLAVGLERYLRIEAAERLTVMTTAAVMAAVAFAFVSFALFFLGFGLVKMFAPVVGSEAACFFMLSGVLVLMLLIIFLLRKPLVESRCVRLFSRALLSHSTLTERILDRRSEDEKLRKLAESLARELDDYEKGGES